jgi:flagellar L-ring protein precursor FlgH
MTMTARHTSLAFRIAVLAMAAVTVSACNTLTKLSEVGEAPKTSRIQDPTKAQGYMPVSLPMPAPTAPQPGANSLWRPGARAFFKDQRANEIGDILTVTVNITESAKLQNQTQATTDSSEAAKPFSLFGTEQNLHKFLPQAVDATKLFSFGSTSGMNGNGQIGRQEQVVVNLAAVITQKLPNGNLVISGRQELRVNNEMREVSVQGVIRPEDITSNNIITSDHIAEARITYGGRGTLSDIQQPRYGQQIFDIIAPF